MSRRILIEDDASQIQDILDRLRRLENANVPAVTSLPSEASDGQEVVYRFQQAVIPADASWLYWVLRWDGALGAWLPVGAQGPVFAYQPPLDTAAFGAGTWGSVNASDPRATVPLNGDYDVEWGCGQFWVSSLGDWYVSCYPSTGDQTANGTEPTQDICSMTATTVSYTSGRASKKMTGLAAGTVLRQRYYATVAGNLSRGTAYIKLYPRRITP